MTSIIPAGYDSPPSVDELAHLLSPPPPATMPALLRQLAAKQRKAPTPSQITVHPGGNILVLDFADEAAIHRWAEVAQLDIHDAGQPIPLAAVEPDQWYGFWWADWLGWNVQLCATVPYTAEHEARWVAMGGLERHPRPALVGGGQTGDDR